MSDEPVAVPTAEDVAERLSKPLEKVAHAYAAEVAAQARRCRTEPYTDDLDAALVRRVQRHIAMGSLPLGVQVDANGSTYVGSNDPEVRRLEGPYRRLVMG